MSRDARADALAYLDSDDPAADSLAEDRMEDALHEDEDPERFPHEEA